MRMRPSSSLTFKGKTSVSNSSQCRRRKKLKPEWNSCVNNHSYGLTTQELEQRRQERVSSNLAIAQVQLYDKITTVKRGFEKPTEESTSVDPFYSLDRLTRELTGPGQKLDLPQLLLLSDAMLKASQWLLANPLPPAREPATVHFTKAEFSSSLKDDSDHQSSNEVYHSDVTSNIN